MGKKLEKLAKKIGKLDVTLLASADPYRPKDWKKKARERFREMVEKTGPLPTGFLAFNPEILMRNPIMKFFKYDHLPQHLQDVSKPFCELAEQLHANLPKNAESSVALRKLLESKDAAVRSLIPDEDDNGSAGPTKP